jgi:DNA repair exonuclease SbcCD ATPase subunit
MKLKSCRVQNFGSYEDLEFDFSNLGLSLVYGATGSGKSTLQDIAAWILFGVTAKGGNVDDVRNWASSEPTSGAIKVELPSSTISVIRVRGTHSENDLFWLEDDSTEIKRGKDITETQKLLEERLGVTEELYLTGAYFHEFSKSANFFLATAKDRRDLFERLAPLDLPIKLAQGIAEDKKVTKALLKEEERKLDRQNGRISQAALNRDGYIAAKAKWTADQDKNVSTLKARSDSFDKDKISKLKEIQTKIDNFEAAKSIRIDKYVSMAEKLDGKIQDDEYFDSKLKSLGEGKRCPTCNNPSEEYHKLANKVHAERVENDALARSYTQVMQGLKDISEQENPYLEQLADAESMVNYYQDQIAVELTKKNPFDSQLDNVETEIESLLKTRKILEDSISSIDYKLVALDTLTKLSLELRAKLLTQTVQNIQDETNRYLSTYFDSEFQVTFSLPSSDKLEVEITKNGYPCVYRQLSKGQRGLLKLTFVVSTMNAAANNAGVHFDTLFFDEALDGLDSDLKVKAFSLFQELEKEHGSILVIEHSTEFKSLFDRRYEVTLVEDKSVVRNEE